MAANTPTTLASRLKQRYNKEICEIVPAVSDIQRQIDFKRDIELGASAEFDVQLSHESGFTIGTGATTLNGSINQVTARASVGAWGMTLQTQVSYDLITRANSNEKAFAKFADGKFLNMVSAFRNREEWLLLNGRRSCGKVESNTSGAIVITKATWCPAFWASQVGAVFVAYDSLAGTTQRNGDITVASVDVSTRTVTFTGTSSAIVANDFIFIKGQVASGRYGIMDIAYNTGTIFGISAATYPLWASNSYDIGTSSYTIGKSLLMAGAAANKGCAGETLINYVPPMCFQNMVADESALRRYSAERTRDAQTGFESLKVLGATGTIEIKPHLYMKEGETVMWAPNYSYIIGSSEATSQLAKDGDIMFDLETTTAKEMRMFSDTNGFFTERPGYVVYGTRSDSLALHT